MVRNSGRCPGLPTAPASEDIHSREPTLEGRTLMILASGTRGVLPSHAKVFADTQQYGMNRASEPFRAAKILHAGDSPRQPRAATLGGGYAPDRAVHVRESCVGVALSRCSAAASRRRMPRRPRGRLQANPRIDPAAAAGGLSLGQADISHVASKLKLW